MKVSVIVSTVGRPRLLRDTLTDLLAQEYGDLELIVVDQSAEEDVETRDFFAEHRARLRHHRLSEPSLPLARNAGLGLAGGEAVIFVDDDVRIDGRDFISRHTERYRDPAVGGVAGRVEEALPPNAPPGVAKIDLFGRVYTNFSSDRAVRVATAKGCNMSFRRKAILGIGGFDARYGGSAILEETDACYRLRAAGWDLVYEPRAAVRHLFAAAGGCRTGSWREERYWLFHNSALFYRRAKPAAGRPFFLAAFAARALLYTARERGTVSDVLYLLHGLVEGFRAGSPRSIDGALQALEQRPLLGMEPHAGPDLAQPPLGVARIGRQTAAHEDPRDDHG